MNTTASEAAPPTHVTPELRLTFLAFVLWLVGATLARKFGLWIGIGSVAILLGTLILVTPRGAAVRQLLRPKPLPLLFGTAAGLVMVAVTQFLFPLAVLWLPVIAPSTASRGGGRCTACITASAA